MNWSCLSGTTYLGERAQLLSRAERLLVSGSPDRRLGERSRARGNMVPEGGTGRQPEATAEAIVDGWFHTGDGGT